jgi:hypothetical protein
MYDSINDAASNIDYTSIASNDMMVMNIGLERIQKEVTMS